jgi:heptosyltransferase-2
MHIALAARTPVVALFGPTNERAWGPYTPPGSGLAAAVVRAPGTRPVMYVGSILGKHEEELGAKAMAAITPDMVMAAAERVFPALTSAG